jgi:hypothetical protein
MKYGDAFDGIGNPLPDPTTVSTMRWHGLSLAASLQLFIGQSFRFVGD